MVQYKVWNTGDIVEVTDPKKFIFPASGEKVLCKARPPIAKTSTTD